jgi:TRAP-type C4-dicarboxylate transport system permease small subunit
LSAGSRKHWWDRVEQATRVAETWLIVGVLGALILFGATQIVLRNFFSIGFAWGDGAARLAVLWLALLGALAATRDGRHISMGVITRWLPERMHVLASTAADAFGAAVSGALAWYSWVFVRDSREFGDVLLTGIPAWWLQAVMPIAFALMTYQFLAHAARRLRAGAPIADTSL